MKLSELWTELKFNRIRRKEREDPRKMSLVGETTFSKIGDLYCKCEWPPVEEGEMFLTLIHSDSAWTAILDKNSLDFGPRAADYEQVQHGIVTWSLAIMIKL